MKRIEKRALARLLAGLLVLCTVDQVTAGVFTGENLDKPFEVHGRLGCYVGSPAFRIWIVGSKRILGVSDRPRKKGEPPAMPQRLLDLFQEHGWCATTIYGDFQVKPLRPDKKGHMRPVEILSVTNLVVTVKGDVIINERD